MYHKDTLIKAFLHREFQEMLMNDALYGTEREPLADAAIIFYWAVELWDYSDKPIKEFILGLDKQENVEEVLQACRKEWNGRYFPSKTVHDWLSDNMARCFHNDLAYGVNYEDVIDSALDTAEE